MNKQFLRIFAFLFIFGSFCPAFLQAADPKKIKFGSITYQEIGDDYISSFGMVESEKPQPIQSTDKKKLDLTIPVLTEHEKRQFVFGLLARNEVSTPGNDLIDNALRITLNDLDVYYGSGKDPKETLMNHVNNTVTIFGEVVLAQQLAKPVADLVLLKRRQALIKELTENRDLAQEVESILQQVKRAESGFLSYWRDNDPVSEKLFKDLYFSKMGLKKLNNSSCGLETLVRLDNLGTAWKLGGDFVQFVAINYLMSRLGAGLLSRLDIKGPNGKPLIPEPSLKNSMVQTLNTIGSFINPVTFYRQIKNVPLDIDAASRENELLGLGAYSNERRALMNKMFYGTYAIKAVLIPIIIGYKAYTVKAALSEANQTKNAIAYLQTRLIDVACVVDACKQMNNLSHQNKVFSDGVLAINATNALLNGSTRTQEFQELISLLQTNTFKGSASFFSLSGRVLAANRLMAAQKEEFAAALIALGELDACLSMAKLYKKMKNERVNYCFVKFVEKEKPYVKLVNFWNPFINSSVVVTNSLELGQDADAAKIILTGSNTGGKSTILKAIMTDLLLANTFGLSASQEAITTQFSFIGSYLRVNDDTALGESKFKAEVMRAKLLCEVMDSLPKNQFGFVVIDELFTGTSSAGAASAAAKVALKLALLENNLYILATHFPSLTELENDHKGLIKNCKVEIYKDDLGNLVRPFKLEAGISSHNVANDILNAEIQDIEFGL